MSADGDRVLRYARRLAGLGGARGGATLGALVGGLVAALAAGPGVAGTPLHAAAGPALLGGLAGWFCVRIALRLDLVEERLAALATVDDLTQTFNRRHLLTMTQNEIERVRRFGGSFALLMVAVDGFRELNERHGRLAGDKILQTLTATVRRQIRPIDLLARYGGAEFVLLQPHARAEDALHLATRLRDMLAGTPVIAGSEVLEFTVCIGVADCTDPRPGLEPLIRRAEDALHEARERGPGRVAVA